MSADFTPEKEDYKILTPFKMQVLTNFPYIEADFDALTNYQLLCKIVEYLNGVIHNENEITEQMNSLYNAYVLLQNYVNEYFDNLDVQEEINNKLDDMAESGSLQAIIEIYLRSNRKVIMIGDSYANRENSWQDRLKDYAGLTSSNCVLNRKSSTGMIATIDNTNFITMLTDNVTFDPNEVTDIICCGGMNDRFHSIADIETAIGTFISTARSTYPNANIYLGFISWVSPAFDNYSSTIGSLAAICNAWKRATTHGDLHTYYLNNVEYSMHNTEHIDSSYAHPDDTAQAYLAQNIMQAWVTGSCDVEQSDAFGITPNTEGHITAVSGQFIGGISNGLSWMKTNGAMNITFDSTEISLGSTSIEIGTLNGGFLMGVANTNAIPVAVLLNVQGKGYYKQPCELYLNEGKLYIKFQVCDTSGWISGRVTSCTISEFTIIGTSMQQY